eukprot:5156622-Prymnesium_polylepis.1
MDNPIVAPRLSDCAPLPIWRLRLRPGSFHRHPAVHFLVCVLGLAGDQRCCCCRNESNSRGTRTPMHSRAGGPKCKSRSTEAVECSAGLLSH